MNLGQGLNRPRIPRSASEQKTNIRGGNSVRIPPPFREQKLHAPVRVLLGAKTLYTDRVSSRGTGAYRVYLARRTVQSAKAPNSGRPVGAVLRFFFMKAVVSLTLQVLKELTSC